MFPYSFPNLGMAFSIFIYTLSETINHHNSNTDVIRNIILCIGFLLVAKSHYKNKPNNASAKAFIFAFNLAVFPIIIAAIIVIKGFLDDGEFGDAIEAYIFPFIYTPIIFVVSFLVTYIWLKISQGYSKNNK